MTTYLCATCGIQYSPAPQPPPFCAICSDARQFVGFDRQQWITLDHLRTGHTNRFAVEEPGVHSIHTEPAFGIGQRAFVIQTPKGNLLWDCLALIDQPTIDAIHQLGWIAAIAISHPHYYTTMIEWSAAFGNIPIHLHTADRMWVMRPQANIRFWEGDTFSPLDGLTLIHTPGHFDGFQVLHMRDAAAGKGALFSADQPQVCSDANWLSFMFSYPNYIPLCPTTVRNIVRTLEPWEFDRIYGAFPHRTVSSGAKSKLQSSMNRYLDALAGASPAEILGRR